MKAQKSTLIPLFALIVALIVMFFGNNIYGRLMNQESNQPNRTITFNDSSSGTYIEGNQINYHLPTQQSSSTRDSAINELSRQFGELSKTLENSNKEPTSTKSSPIKGKTNRTILEAEEGFINSPYPKIIKVTDNFGNEWNWEGNISSRGYAKQIYTNVSLKAGQTLEFVIEANDPQGLGLTYCINVNAKTTGWDKNSKLSYTLEDSDIGEKISVSILIRGNSERRADPTNEADHYVIFHYKGSYHN